MTRSVLYLIIIGALVHRGIGSASPGHGIARVVRLADRGGRRLRHRRARRATGRRVFRYLRRWCALARRAISYAAGAAAAEKGCRALTLGLAAVAAGDADGRRVGAESKRSPAVRHANLLGPGGVPQRRCGRRRAVFPVARRRRYRVQRADWASPPRHAAGDADVRSNWRSEHAIVRLARDGSPLRSSHSQRALGGERSPSSPAWPSGAW